jgi:hypothetical protein
MHRKSENSSNLNVQFLYREGVSGCIETSTKDKRTIGELFAKEGLTKLNNSLQNFGGTMVTK